MNNPIVSSAARRGLLPTPLATRETAGFGTWQQRRMLSTRVAFIDAPAGSGQTDIDQAAVVAYVGDFDPDDDPRVALELLRVRQGRPIPKPGDRRRLDAILGDNAQAAASRFYFADASMANVAGLLSSKALIALQMLSNSVAAVGVLATRGVFVRLRLDDTTEKNVRADLRAATLLLAAIHETRTLFPSLQNPLSSSTADSAASIHHRHVSGGDRVTIAVAPIAAPGVNAAARQAVEDAIAESINASADRQAVAASDLESVLGGTTRAQLLRCTTTKAHCLARALPSASVGHVVAATLRRRGKRHVLQASLVSAKRPHVRARGQASMQLHGGLYEKTIRRAVQKLTAAAKANGNGTRSSIDGPHDPIRVAVQRARASTVHVIQGRLLSTPARLATVADSGRIDLRRGRMRLAELLRMIKQRMGVRVLVTDKAVMETTVNLTAENAPLLAIVAQICRERGWSFDRAEDEIGAYILVNTEGPQLLNFTAEGPLVLLWYGLHSSVSTTPQPTAADRYVMTLVTDPMSHIQTPLGEYPRDQRIVVTGSKGKAVTLRSNHDRRVLRTINQWELKPHKALRAATSRVGVTVPFRAPTSTEHGVIDWNHGATLTRGDVQLTIAHIARYRAQREDGASGTEYRATVKLVHAHVSRAAADRDRKKARRSRVKKELRDLRQRAAISVRRVDVMARSGRYVPAQMRLTEGPNRPWDGYDLHVRHTSFSHAERPERLRIAWVTNYEPYIEALQLENGSSQDQTADP